MTQEQLEAKYTAMFYAKDFSCIRKIEDDNLAKSLKESPPTTEEIQQVMESRKSDNPFSQQEMFLGGEKDVKQEVNLIKSALLKKDGLVDLDKQDTLRSQIETAFSDDILDKLSEDIRDTESVQKPRENSVVNSSFTFDLFNSVQSTGEVEPIPQSEINRNYILALTKVKKDHADYYRTIKEDLMAHLGGTKAEAQDRYLELKKLSGKIHEIEAIARASGNLDAHSDIKQIKLLRSKLSDENRDKLVRSIATALTIQRRDELNEIKPDEPMPEREKAESKIFGTESLYVKRAHVDSWTMFLLFSKLQGEKQADLAEWGLIDEL